MKILPVLVVLRKSADCPTVLVTGYDEGRTASGSFEFSGVLFQNYREVAYKAVKISEGKFENVTFRVQSRMRILYAGRLNSLELEVL